MSEVWETFGDDTYVPEEQDMLSPEEWQEVERNPTFFERLRQAFALPPKEPEPDPGVEMPPVPPYPPYERGYREPEPAKRPDAGSPEPEQPETPFRPVEHEPATEPMRVVHVIETECIVERPVPVEHVVERIIGRPAQPENVRKTIPPDAQKSSQRIPETIPNNSQRIPNRAQNEPELIDAPEPENALNMPEIEDEGDIGRKRKNEDTGIYGDISVKDIILFRYIKKRHWPDLSGDMKAWYEHFYFKRPVKGEKPYRGRDYEQHKRAYERGQEWIAEYNASTAGAQTVGHSGSAPIPFPKRASH